LRAVCADDPGLLAEVQEILVAAEAAPDFLEKAALDAFSAGLADVSTALIGKRLGAYEIVSMLASGGMGSVFLARRADQQYEQQVAIKVIKGGLLDADGRRRFGLERQTLASLNHPNIAIIHGLEQAEGAHALVMELVEGEDLAQRIARGPIPIDEALPIAKQIAEALEAAHEQGIMHRDLKPANIKIRPDGTVKVLDFGLAKAMGPVGSTPNMSQSPTITTPAMTQAGMILGTAAYMSPEQAKGRLADKRSDVWAFGCVLYEMLTGKRAFEGDDVSDTLAAVLRGEPDWGALPADTPTPIGKLLRGCLQKDRRERVPDIAVARLEIKEALAMPAGSGACRIDDTTKIAAANASTGSQRRIHDRVGISSQPALAETRLFVLRDRPYARCSGGNWYASCPQPPARVRLHAE
jgi:serine/threonine protein kinase